MAKNKKTAATIVQKNSIAVHLQSAMDGAYIALMMIDRDFNIIYANQAARDLLKKHDATLTTAYPAFKADAVIGSCIDSFHNNPAQLHQLLSDPSTLPYSTDIQIGPLKFELNISAQIDPEGNYIGNTLVWSDVTIAREQETVMIRLQSAADGAQANLMICDSDLNISYANPSVVGMLRKRQNELRQIWPGFDINNLIGTCINDFHKNHAHQHTLLRDASRLPAKMEIKIAGVEFDINVTMISGPDGEHMGNMVEWHDITERKHAEAKNNQLQRQLQQAQKMEAIGLLTAGIAHDFNNILASIIGYTELTLEIMTQYDNDKIKSYLKEVYNSGLRARDLVTQMLTFSRSSKDGLKPMVLSPLLKKSLQMFAPLLPSSIEIDMNVGDDDLVIVTNPMQLHQLIMNLCINARDAMNEKGRITIKIERVNAVTTNCQSCHENFSGDYIQLLISDSGSGIKPKIMDRIFDPFYTTKEVGKGTGMGLSMVHGIMHEHGGHVRVESGPEKGTTFTLFFPLIDAQISKQESAAQIDIINVEDRETKISSNRTFAGNVLIVDDDAMIGNFIAELLKNRGCHVSLQTDSRTALSIFKENPQAFNLVITDQTMPGITGVELAQTAMAIRPGLPVILCTGYSHHINRARAKSLGIRGYVSKPIDKDNFLALVESLL